MCGQTEKERGRQSKEELNTRNTHTLAFVAFLHMHLPGSVTNSDFFPVKSSFFLMMPYLFICIHSALLLQLYTFF